MRLVARLVTRRGRRVTSLHGFTAALTSFVGREDEIAAVADLLERGRLVTVAGPGGVGKTRLADQVARRVADRFADGVWLVELAGVHDPALAAAAVADALEVPLAAKPATESLIGVLARRQLLLVLDNCEHLRPTVAELCGALLPAADEVRVLATSREPLGVGGESRYRLGPLRLPSPGDAEGAGSEAVTLFTHRARMADPSFSAEPGDSAVARLVARLDGMPLAIELAAARVDALGAGQLADLLDDGFRLLAGTDPLAADRHRTLAATAGWSYRLLTEPERRVFRMLSVLPGPFTLAAAQAVAGAGADAAALRLVDCSLLAPPRPGPDGRARYVMLQTLRDYSAERLAPATEDRAHACAGLARYALHVAEQAATGLRTSTREFDAGRWLDAEDTMVHQALTWALEHNPATALQLAIALAPWWALRGRQATGYPLLTDAATAADASGQDWCAAQVWLGLLGVGGSEADRLRHYTAARDGLAAEAPSPLLVRALIGRAGCLANLGPAAEAAAEARHALGLARQIADAEGEARALRLLGLTAYYGGDPAGSLAWLRQAQRIDPAAISGRALRECVSMLTLALLEAGERDEAGVCGARSLALARQAGAPRDEANALLLLAHVDLLRNRPGHAAAHLREVIGLIERTGHGVLLIDCLDMCGHLCEQTQRPGEALTVWAAHAACLRDGGLYDLPADQRWRRGPLSRARQAVGPARTRAAERRGAAMGQAVAAEYAALLIGPEAEPAGSGAAGVARAGTWTAGTGAAGAAEVAGGRAGLPQLSARERELVTLVARGHTNIQIAGRLYISVRTVGSHLDRIRDKTGCRRRADLTRLALQAGLV